MLKIINEMTKQEIPIDFGVFPDKTQLIHIANNVEPRQNIAIYWKYAGDEELATLMFITRHLQQIEDIELKLVMPYIPNARFDRVNNPDEVFTLKYFAEFINNLHFNKVSVLDAHSNVSLALFDHLIIQSPTPYIQKAIDATQPDILFMPDEGAHKRYATAFKNIPSTFGIKHRDWRTGEIKNYEIAEPELVKNANVLIIDDICSKGGTFYFGAKALHEAGATNVDLYITHCEENIKTGKLLDDDSPIRKIYTADPLYGINPYTIKLKAIEHIKI